MKKFNNEIDDKYPTFSFCFKGDRFHWFHDFEIFNSFGLNSTQYARMIKGQNAEKYQRNAFNRSYTKVPVFSSSSKEMSFKSFYLQIPDFLRSLHFATEATTYDTIITDPREWNSKKVPAIHISHQTADKICFSRKSTDFPDSIRLHDLIIVDSNILKFYDETKMDIYIHYPNQLIRSLGKAKYSTTFSHFLSILNGTIPKILEFKLSESKTIRRRHDSNEKCSRSIKNYDKYLQQKMGEKLDEEIGCVPIYIKSMLSNNSKFSVCHSPLKLRQAYKILNDLKAIIEQYEKPCDEMLVLSIDSINNNPAPILKDIAIKFIYTEKIYEEIQYIKAIEFENWLSNVGGFVGIFLGYSMMQFPELLFILVIAFDKNGRGRFQMQKNIKI